MAMAGVALLRSVATKMARAPPRLPYALEHHGRLPTSGSVGLSLSRFSTSSGSTPSSANFTGSQTQNKKVSSGIEWYRLIDGFKKAAPKAAFFLVFGGCTFMYFVVIPALDRIHDNMNAQRLALATMMEDLEKHQERTRAILLSNKESQIEATNVSEGQKITGIGTK